MTIATSGFILALDHFYWAGSVSRIFLSHSSIDNAEAVALRDWLADNGWKDEIFLDLDPQRGIAAGERWERKLHEAANRCEAVLFLVSKAWLASVWCRKELNLAHRLNKRLFGVLIEDLRVGELPEDLTGTWQIVGLAAGRDHVMLRAILPITHVEAHVSFSAEGLQRLRHGLEEAGLDPRYFAWPPANDPRRAPYRGLVPLEADDVGIFFGRDAPIVQALDRLRGLRQAACPRLFVILGASGAGKSSFLRAGLLPRLKRDDRAFLPLPPIRPEHAAITGAGGLVAALVAACTEKGLSATRAELREATGKGAAALRPHLRHLVERGAASGAKPPTLVFAIDQAEELFRTEATVEGEALLTLLRDLVSVDDPALIALFAIRSDSYDELEHAKALDGLSQEAFPLLPMPRGAYQTVIEGPAQRLAKAGREFEIEPSLTQALLTDLEAGGGSDALPLLAFTLAQLYLDHEAAGRLTSADYEHFGGLRGAIAAASARVLAEADKDPRSPTDRDAQLTLLRRGLIPWLAGIDPDTKTPRRRQAPATQIPEEARPLIDLLVEQRLLTRAIDPTTRETTLEPAHESLLRQWGILKGWLEEDFGRLVTLEGVKRAARDWDANARDIAWAAHAGSRLEEATRLDTRPDLAAMLDASDRAYLAACREKQTETYAKERALFVFERRAVRRTHIRLIYSSMLAIVAGALFVAYVYYQHWRDAFNQAAATWIGGHPSTNLTSPPEPAGQLALELSISSVLVASVLGFCCVFMARLSVHRGGPNPSRSALRTRVIMGSSIGGAIAGIIWAPIVFWYFAGTSRPTLTPEEVLPLSIVPVVVIAYSIVYFDSKRLNGRRLLAAGAAALAVIPIGGLVAVALSGFLYYSGALSVAIIWTSNHTSVAGVMLIGTVIYGIPVGITLGVAVGIGILLAERWSGKRATSW